MLNRNHIILTETFCIKMKIPSQMSFDPGHQLQWIERFGHIIVGPDTQPLNFIQVIRFRSQHDNRHPVFFPYADTGFQPVHFRHHHVGDHEHSERLAARRGAGRTSPRIGPNRDASAQVPREAIILTFTNSQAVDGREDPNGGATPDTDQPGTASAPVANPEAPTFAELDVHPDIVRALRESGIERTFAIQELTLPLAMRGISNSDTRLR